MNFVVFSDDWGVHPSSCQHIFRVLAAQHPTIWVNTVGMRLPRPSLEDARKVLRKVGTMLRTRGAVGAVQGPAAQAGPAVCAPFMLPFQGRWARAWNRRSVRKAVLEVVRRRGMSSFCAVTTVPNVYDVIGSLGAEKVIYYCVDDFSEWPGLDRSTILAMERQLLQSVRAVICTSHALVERFRADYPTTLLSHGVDLDLFARPVESVHPILRDIPEPRVGYYGLFDARTDLELLLDVARKLPEVSFVITGPTEGDTSRARVLPNIHLTGPVPYAELPQVVAGWRACLLPYRLNELTVKINPLKLKEYLATGKPVISTPLPEATKLLPHLRIAATPEAWTAALRAALDGSWGVDRATLAEFLKPHAWTRKAEELLATCQSA